jgi:hypothetical protein
MAATGLADRRHALGLDQLGARRGKPFPVPLKPFGQRVGAHEMCAWAIVPAQERPPS